PGTPEDPADAADPDAPGDDLDDDPGDNSDNSRARKPPQLGRKPLTVRDLSAVTRWVSDHFGVTADLRPETVRVSSRRVSRRRAGQAGGSDFLNSFIAADLAMVADRLAGEDPPAALGAYLTEAARLPDSDRVDLRASPDVVLAGVAPDRFPLGRWPARTEHPLVLSQQFAVNKILDRLGDSEGVYAVNGPPGTGKTTQLRDLIAAVLVRRAERLAELARPDDAFHGAPLRWRTSGYQRSVRALRPELTGFEMVVASANNGAVENVSNEIPALGSVDEEWRAQAAYFPEQGRLLLGGKPAWGTLAARLGNKQNRSDFRNAYWFGPRRDRRRPGAPGTPPETGMRELLQQAAGDPAPAKWRDAVSAFRQARRTVLRLRDERQRVADALWDGARLAEAVDAAGRGVSAAEQRLAARRRADTLAAEELADATAVFDLRRAAREEHQARRPGLFSGLFTLGGSHRDWQAEDRRLAAEERDARQEHERRAALAAGCRAVVRQAEAELVEARDELRRRRERQERATRLVRDAERRWGRHLPAVRTEEQQSTDERELSSPWSDPEFTRARTRLFLAAMDLHRAFLTGAADRMRKNLDAAMDVLCGEAPATLPAATTLAAWQSFFLAVPVVSTTFASLDRMFSGLGPASLGWMLVDEAGQATAQMPVGAIWRARRAVVVGDPLQLEPVVTLPHTGQQALRRSFGVGEEWVPSGTSAQRVADRLTRYGTWLPSPDDGGRDGRVWVGSPLRVHRRCEEPMFGISNDIAYDGLMVHGVHRAEDYPVARRGVWWDVGGAGGDGKWSPEEGAAANVIVHRLIDQGLDPVRGLFVVSPFRDVVAGLHRALCRTVPRARIGTVHTTQGKEADVVLLVLGAGGDKAGARAWAAARPNLLNVAVSRARRRLFVVGDHGSWSRNRHFDTLARRLPRMTVDDQRAMRDLTPPTLPDPCRCRP
ncbi:DEAD/DEAH box helicase, partial [Streptomyces alkaliterrae]